MELNILHISVPFASFLLGLLIGKGIYEIYLLRTQQKIDQKILEAEKKAQLIIEKAEKKSEEILASIKTKEDKIEKKLNWIESEKQRLIEKEEQLNLMIKEQEKIIEKIAGITKEEAKEYLLNEIEKKYSEMINKILAKNNFLLQNKLKEETSNLIVSILPRVVSEVSEFSVTTIDLPDETIKGKIIGREGRNIQFFEKITGTELIIDDTPGVVRISSFDPEKRFIAAKTLNLLIEDGRINPIYIEKTYEDVKSKFDSYLYDIGQKALLDLGLSLMQPEIVTMIGRMHLRYSYGQNLLIHSKEVALISEILAGELGYDMQLAKKAGLLHDIGKLLVESREAHAKAGGEFLRKYGFNEIIVNAAEGHHFDVPLIHPISYIVAAADAISASRPGARFNTKGLLIEKMSNLEKLILGIEGVEKVNIYQAGRQIIVFVNSQKVSDLDLEKMVDSISKKIEDQLDYPGLIRLVVIRENKLVTYLR